jgi:anaerobic magnesium-protoporphyrin IX monomethyl ester cyclase
MCADWSKKIHKQDCIVLVMPSYNQCVKSLFVFHEGQAIGSKPPLGLMSIATYLKQEGYSSVEIFDATLGHLTAEQTVAALLEKKPAIIGFSVMTDVWYNALTTIRLLKEVLPDTVICIGGAHASIYPEESLQASQADMLIAGDGEFAFKQALDALAEGRPPADLDGVFWKDARGIIQIPPVKLAIVENIDILPAPDRRLIPHEAYNTLLSHLKSTTMITSRGCPCSCVFCKLNVQKVVSRPPRLVVDEFEAIAREGFKHVEVYDDTFTWHRKRVLEICDEIIKRGISIEWSVRSRVNKVDHEMLSAMKKAGCKRIHFGIESGNDRILRGSRKGITKDQARKAIRLAKELDFEVLTYYMVGFLDETLQDANDTFEFALELDSHYVAFAVLIPYPGTAIYLDSLSRGIIPIDHWRDFTLDPTPNYNIPYLIENVMTREEMIEFVSKAHFRFYWRPRKLLWEILSIKTIGDFSKRLSMGIKLLKRYMASNFVRLKERGV